jgi:hypothetical protein
MDRATVSRLVLCMTSKTRRRWPWGRVSHRGPGRCGGDGEGDGTEAFGRSRECFEGLVTVLADPAGGRLTHAQMEDQLTALSRELVRVLHQDSLDLRAAREQRREPVTGSDQVRGLWVGSHSKRVRCCRIRTGP